MAFDQCTPDDANDNDDRKGSIKTDKVINCAGDIKMDVVSYFTLSSITVVLGLPFGI